MDRFFIPEGYRPFDENIQVLRMAPGDGLISFEWTDFSNEGITCSSEYSVQFKCEGQRTFNQNYPLDIGQRTYEFDGFEVGKTYCMYLIRKNGTQIRYSLARKFQTGVTPGIVVNYIHPNDRTYISGGCSPASPSIVKLPSGRILVSHDIYERETEFNLSKLFYSDDDGKTFHYMTDLNPCFWGKLFWHKGAVYIFACSGAPGDLIISKSEDEGKTWSGPTYITSLNGRCSAHKAPVPVIVKDGKLYSAVEYSYGNNVFSSVIVSADLNGDLMDASNYTLSEETFLDDSWPGTKKGSGYKKMIEGNAVETPGGKLVNILRYNVEGAEPESGYAIMLDFDPDNPEKAQIFNSVIDFMGSHTKFSVLYNNDRKCYYSLVNRATLKEGAGKQRNILSLVKSEDLRNWEQVYDVLNYQDNGWPEDAKMTAFQYVDFIFDGENGKQDKILAVSRTAINGARMYHDNNYVTFHEISLGQFD